LSSSIPFSTNSVAAGVTSGSNASLSLSINITSSLTQALGYYDKSIAKPSSSAEQKQQDETFVFNYVDTEPDDHDLDQRRHAGESFGMLLPYQGADKMWKGLGEGLSLFCFHFRVACRNIPRFQ
jgi:hypothetical protein